MVSLTEYLLAELISKQESGFEKRSVQQVLRDAEEAIEPDDRLEML